LTHSGYTQTATALPRDVEDDAAAAAAAATARFLVAASILSCTLRSASMSSMSNTFLAGFSLGLLNFFWAPSVPPLFANRFWELLPRLFTLRGGALGGAESESELSMTMAFYVFHARWIVATEGVLTKALSYASW
jgi:hypothetical protein